MGNRISYAVPPPAPLLSAPSPLVLPAAADVKSEKVDYMKLPTPVKFDEIQREAMDFLNPELFEGFKLNLNMPLNQRFSLSHSVLMGNESLMLDSGQIIKVPSSLYGLNAMFSDPKVTVIGRVQNDGRLLAFGQLKATDNIVLKMQGQVSSERQGAFQLDVDYTGSDYQVGIEARNKDFCRLNYMQSITPTFSLGGELLWDGSQRKAGISAAARYDTDKAIAAGQIFSRGMVSVSYVHKVSEKINLATNFLYNSNTKETTTSVGYDYFLRECRVRGRVDSNGVVAAFLERGFSLGKLLVSAEVDHWKKDHKFGIGFEVVSSPIHGE